MKMDLHSADLTDEEMDEEEMEAMLYSQVHFEYDESTDQGLNYLQSASSETAGNVFSVVSFTHYSHTQASRFPTKESRDSPVSVSSDDDSLLPASVNSVPAEDAWFRDTSGKKLGAPDTGLILLDCNESIKLKEVAEPESCSHQSKETSQSLQAEDTPQKKVDSAQADSQQVIEVHSVVSSTFKKSASEAKFDLEAELGIKESKSVKRKCKSDDEIDTITVDPAALELSDSDTLSSFISLERDKPKQTMKPQQRRDYTKPLKRLLSSSTSTKLSAKERIVVESDNSSSTSSSSSSSAESSDCESDSEMEGLNSVRPEGETSSAKPQLDLNWNVNSTDRQTIQTVEKSRQAAAAGNKWKIDDADVKLKGSQASRYYSKNDIQCNNCKKTGHLSKVCPEPKKVSNCGLCGEPGHFSSRCNNRLCFNCNLPGHFGSKCPAPKRSSFTLCARCRVRGHSEDLCPDQWRQYHSTITTTEELVQKKKSVNSLVYCCNCAKRGHFAYECKQDRMNKFVFASYPFIVRYGKPTSNTGKEKGQFHISRRYKKFDSDSEPEDRSYHSKKLKSAHPADVHTKQHSHSIQASSNHPSHKKGSVQQKVQSHSNKQTSQGGQHSSSAAPSLSSFAQTFMGERVESKPEKSYRKDWKDDRKSYKKDWRDESKSHKKKRKEWKRSYKADQKEGKGKQRSRSKSRDRRGDSVHSEASSKKSSKKKGAKSPKGKKGKGRETHPNLKLTFHPQESNQRKVHEKQVGKEKQKGRKESKHQHQTSSSRQGTKFEPLTITSNNGFRTTVTTKNFFRNVQK